MKQPVLHLYDMDPQIVAFSTTRQGGYSQGSYGEFNINRYCGDNAEAIRRNREALCQLLGISDDRLLMPHQVHLTKAALVDEAFLQLSADERQERLEGVDALMTNVPGVCIGVSTADCIPLLLYDVRQRAVCAIHAGWRGTVARIAEHAAQQMIRIYGTSPSDLKVQIGPGIHLDSFEVGDEVYDAFLKAGFQMSAISQRREKQSDGQRIEKWHIDLPECNRQQLLALGIPAANINVSAVCTFQHHDQYFSARRLGINSGRIFSGILLKS